MKALNLLRVVAHAKWGSAEGRGYSTSFVSVVDPFQTGLRRDRLWLSEKVIPPYAGSNPKLGTPPLLGCISNIASHKLACGSKRDTHGTSKKTACITILAQDMLKSE